MVLHPYLVCLDRNPQIDHDQEEEDRDLVEAEEKVVCNLLLKAVVVWG